MLKEQAIFRAKIWANDYLIPYAITKRRNGQYLVMSISWIKDNPSYKYSERIDFYPINNNNKVD